MAKAGLIRSDRKIYPEGSSVPIVNRNKNNLSKINVEDSFFSLQLFLRNNEKHDENNEIFNALQCCCRKANI